MYKPVFLFSFAFLLTVQAREIKLGINVPFTGVWPGGPYMASAILIALDKINNHTDWVKPHTLTYVMRDSRCEAKSTISNLLHFYADENPKVDAYIGPGCSQGCLPGGHIAYEWNLPMVAWGCSSSALSDKELYPNFVRTVGTYNLAGDLLKAFLEEYGWDRVGLMCSTASYWSELCNRIKVTMEAGNSTYKVPYFGSFDPSTVADSTLQAMFVAARKLAHGKSSNKMVTKSILYVKCHKSFSLSVFVFGAYGGPVRQLMLAAHDLGMLDGTYVFMGFENILDSCKTNDGRDTEACNAFEGFININVYLPKDDVYNAFAQEVYERAPEMGYNIESVSKVSKFLLDLLLV